MGAGRRVRLVARRTRHGPAALLRGGVASPGVLQGVAPRSSRPAGGQSRTSARPRGAPGCGWKGRRGRMLC
jgi:hypothetical protein